MTVIKGVAIPDVEGLQFPERVGARETMSVGATVQISVMKDREPVVRRRMNIKFH